MICNANAEEDHHSTKPSSVSALTDRLWNSGCRWWHQLSSMDVSTWSVGHARRPRIDPILDAMHISIGKTIIVWIRRHLRVTRIDWGKFLFIDEVRIALRSTDGRTWVYRRNGDRNSSKWVLESDRFGRGIQCTCDAMGGYFLLY